MTKKIQKFNPVLLSILIFTSIAPFTTCRHRQFKISANQVQKNKFVFIHKHSFKTAVVATIKVRQTPASGEQRGLKTYGTLLIYNKRMYKKLKRLPASASCHKKAKLAIEEREFSILDDGTFSVINQWYDEPGITETYYIYYADCDGHFENVPSQDSIFFSISLENNLDSHLEPGEEHLLTIHYLFGFLTTLAYLPFIKSFYKEVRGRLSELNWPFMIINFIILLKLGNTILELTDLNLIKATGHGSDALSFLAMCCNYFSQYFFCCLLCFLAAGWTITFDSLRQSKVFVPIVLTLAVIKFVVVAVSKMSHPGEEINHQYSGLMGNVLIVSQVSMYSYFIYSTVKNIKAAKIKKVKSFMVRLSLFGSIYFLTFPFMLVLVGMIVSPAYQKPFVEFSRISSEFISIYYLAFITTSEKGQYKNIAYQSMDFVLPT